jgi:hypothetical protein
MPQVNFAADIGKGVALGLKALGGPIATVQQGATKEGEEKTRYTDNDIAAIMGFSHVTRGDLVQPIWTTLNNAKQKNHDTFRGQILTRMMEWGIDCQIPIDTGVFLDSNVVKAIVDLKFNPGEGVAHLNSAAKGLSILSCRARTTGEIERIKEREEALTATEKTRHLDEFVRLQKDQRRAPADNFLELKNNIATFMGLVWVLFGSNCDYYKGLRHIYDIMDLREVMAIKAHFTAEHCRRITWAIIDDGRSYFDNVKTTLDFGNGASVVFPQSFLVDIIRNVRYGILVERGNFPQEWLSQRKTLQQDQGQPDARPHRARAMRGGVTTGSHRVIRAEGTTNTGDTSTGDRSMGDKATIREQVRREVATVEGIPHPTTTSLVTGAQIGTTNATQKLKQ